MLVDLVLFNVYRRPRSVDRGPESVPAVRGFAFSGFPLSRSVHYASAELPIFGGFGFSAWSGVTPPQAVSVLCAWSAGLFDQARCWFSPGCRRPGTGCRCCGVARGLRSPGGAGRVAAAAAAGDRLPPGFLPALFVRPCRPGAAREGCLFAACIRWSRGPRPSLRPGRVCCSGRRRSAQGCWSGTRCRPGCVRRCRPGPPCWCVSRAWPLGQVRARARERWCCRTVVGAVLVLPWLLPVAVGLAAWPGAPLALAAFSTMTI